MTRRMLCLLAVLLTVAGPAAAQTVELAGTTLAVGTAPTSPSGTSVRLDNLGTSGGTLVLLTDTDGDVFERVLAKGDLPAVVGYTDEAETWSLLQTFTSGLTSNGLVTIGGANDLLLGTGGMRVASGSINLRNIADGANIATFGDSAIVLVQPVSASSTLGVTGLTTLAKVKTTGVYAVSAPLLFRNAADSATVMSMADAGLDITGTLGISGLTTAAKIRTTGVYGVASPFTVYAADGTTSRLEVADGGPVLLTDTGTDSYLRYAATGNTSGQRQWRAGNVTGNFAIAAGNDAASTWTTLAQGTSSGGTANGWYWGTAVSDVNPLLSYQTKLGTDIYKYLSLSAAELKVGTLVAQDYIATIGGRVLVGPTTTLTEDLGDAVGDTTITVEHNEMASGDRVLMEADGKVEFLAITSSGSGTGGGDSVELMGDASAAATSITLPTHTTGDTLIVIAFRIGSNTSPTATTGSSGGGTWTNLCNGGADNTSYRVATMTATSAAETSGTWANATHMHAFVFTGVTAVTTCTTLSAAATTTLSYPAMTLADADGSSYVLRAGITNQTSDTSGAMSGYTLLENQTGSSRNSSSFLSDAGQTSVTQFDDTGLTSGNTRGIGIELQGTTTPATGPYTYSVTRDLDGTGRNLWYAGDALFNTGQTGDGFWDIYSIASINGGTEAGPTMCANERTSSTYNAWAARFCAGNLNGLYGNSATDLYGVAFGNYSDVWGQMDATNGLRFFEGGTNQKLRIDPSGYVLVGTSGSGQANTYIDNTKLTLRRGTVEMATITSAGVELADTAGARRVLLDTSGLLLGTTSGTETNALLTSTSLSLRRGTTALVDLSSSGLQLYDTGGTRRVLLDSANLMIGRDGAGEENILVTPTYVTFRVAGTNTLYMDGTSGITVGEVASGKNNVLIDTSGNLSLRTNTTAKIAMAASTGTITLTGDILLSTGGSVTSTGNFELSAANGLTLQQHSAYDTDPGTKGIKWSSGPTLYTWSNNLIANAGTMNWVSGNNAIRMVLYPAENVVYDNPAMRVSVLLESGSVVTPLGVDGAVARTATIYPFADDTSTIGDPSLRFKTINLALTENTSPIYVVVNKGGAGGDSQSALGYIAGFSGTKVAGSCTFTILVGLVTNVTGC